MIILRKILELLSGPERRRVFYLLLMIILMAFLDAIGVASIMPFIAVLTNPDLIETNNFINTLFIYSSIFGVKSNEQFLFTLGILVFFLLVFSLSYKALLTYLQLRFGSMCHYGLTKRMMEKYLNQPYTWFLNRHSAEIGKTILSETGIIISKGLMPLMNLITHGTVSIALIMLLIINEPKLALISVFALGSLYLFIYLLSRRFLTRIGFERVKANEARFTVVSEAFNAAKELKVGSLEKAFLQRFSDPAKTVAKNTAAAGSISQLPRYALEIIAFGGMILLILFMMSKGAALNNVLPLIALYAFAGYRLIPALQNIYASFSVLRFVTPSLDSIYDDFKNLDPSVTKQNNEILSLKKSIVLKDLNYQYPNTSHATVKNINITIPAFSTLGIIGSTGSGKTTVVDIILGLLTAQKGTLKVDDKIINDYNRVVWQRSIGYARKIFL